MSYEDLGGVVTDTTHVTVSFFPRWDDINDVPTSGAYTLLVLDGGDGNFASVDLDAAGVRRLRNLLTRAEKRFYR